jgi:23S rRNA (adenine2503-C2)-methyltransferase
MHEAKTKLLLGLDAGELTALAEAFQQPGYRGNQLFEAIYRNRIASLEAISTLPAEFRKELSGQAYAIQAAEVAGKFRSTDGTERYLIGFQDGQTVEAVWMPEGDDGETGDGSDADISEVPKNFARATICVSSQVGCAVDCRFCLTGLLGVKRNLSAGEIAGQVLAVLRDQQVNPPQDRINLVFMGMGEPFLNYDNFIKAVRLLVQGVGIPQSRMTVSTAGIAPRIGDLGQEEVRPKLAISLNASNDEMRSRLMPINRKWDMRQLLDAARTFPLRNRERVTFEYVLLGQVNDAPEHARELAEKVRGIRAKVNLIAWNPGPGIEFTTPEADRVLRFQRILIDSGTPTFIRRPRGRDIYAACGQLKRTMDAA